MHNTDTLITSLNITPDQAGKIGKGRSNSGRACFYVEGTYTLADGRTIPHRVTSERKKNLQRAIDQERKNIEAKAVSLSAAGFITTKYTFGAGGLVPTPNGYGSRENGSDTVKITPETTQQGAGITRKPPTPQVPAMAGMTPLGLRKGTTFGAALADSNAKNSPTPPRMVAVWPPQAAHA